MVRKKWPLLILLGLMAGGPVFYELTTRIGWVGGADITITLQSTTGRPIKRVEYTPFMRLDAAEQCAADILFCESDIRPARPVDAQTFSISVKSMGTCSPFELVASTFHQERFVVLRIAYADGDHTVQLVTVPDYRYSKTTEVSIP